MDMKTQLNDQGALADLAFEEYDFGNGVTVTDSSGWEYTTPGSERSRKVFAETEREDDGPAPRCMLTFTVRFNHDDSVAEVYAIDGKGQIWGSLGGRDEVPQAPEKSYRVHLYAIVRVPVDVPSALSQIDAISKAEQSVDLNRDFRDGEYADEVVGVLVDEVGDIEYHNTTNYVVDSETGTWVQETIQSAPPDLSMVVQKNEHSTGDPILVIGGKEDRNTILAALRFYQQQGMGEPFNRSDEIHDIATNGNEDCSYDDGDIDNLCERVNSAQVRPLFSEVEVEAGDEAGHLLPSSSM